MTKSLAPFAYETVPNNLKEIVELVELFSTKKRVLVCGGLHPGQSTNAVAALVAEKTKAYYLINATDVDGVYDKDPNKFKHASRFEKVTVSKLEEILGSESVSPGTYDLMDPIALKLISRSRIPTRIIKCDSHSLEALLLLNQRNIGTEIIS
jgi:uridylate kinase